MDVCQQSLPNSKMDLNSLFVEITKETNCIYTKSLNNPNNDLNALISNLKILQENVNEKLSELVEIERNNGSAEGKYLH